MYDLRNSQIYDAAIGRAKYLEKQLQMSEGGLYGARPDRYTNPIRLFGILIWHDRALAYIYGAALGGWFYLITYSLLSLVLPSLVLFLIAALVACAFIWQFHQIEASRSETRTKLIVNNVIDPYTIENLWPLDPGLI